MKRIAIDSYKATEVEKEVLAYWEERSIYPKAKEKNLGKKKFYFLDGPPYTSGKVHVGTAWNKSLKDLMLRYKRMAGFDVWDRAGYDMHGLPVAHVVQKNLGLKSKEDIIAYGLDKFIAACKEIAVNNMLKMNEDFKTMGVWMDFENAYQSVNKSYIEAIWWLVKKAEENKRLYLGKRTMHWCADCSTALAKHEIEYETRTDDSIFVKLPIVGTENEFLIIWTTTPWTIPYNLAVMVGPELEYQKCKVDANGKEEFWFVAKALAGIFIGMVAGHKFEIVEEMTGDKLEGIKYTHPFSTEIKDYAVLSEKHPKLHSVILSAEYVDTTSGTGLVHCAPGCGPEDYEVGYRNGLPAYNNLMEDGHIPEGMGKFSGWKAKTDDKKFIQALDDCGALIASTKVEHEYPNCWRCHQPVVFRTTDQWFFKIEDLKENMVELNKNISWNPDWAGGRQYESWLQNLRDNGITRQRFWGTPLPVWKCTNCTHYEVFGSMKEIDARTGKSWDLEDLHIPHVDKIEFECPDCGNLMKREPDILDVWIDAGSASWNCLDYPTREDLFEELYPADFILEGKDQIRGWFNMLFVASMVSMEKPSFKSVYMHGFIQDAQGRKMSKSVGNYILPEEVISKYGADTMRYYMIGGANPGEDLNYNFDDVETKNKNLLILWNLHKFIIDLAVNSNINPAEISIDEIKEKLCVEDRYILSRLHSTIKTATYGFENFLLNTIPQLGEDLYLDLSRTYIKFIRDKSVTGSDDEKKIILSVLFNVLVENLKILTPVIPFITEKIYANLKESFEDENADLLHYEFKESIHLESWPKHDESLIDSSLEENMVIAQDAIQAILAMREKANVGLRWPLGDVVITTKDSHVKNAINELDFLIKSQTNVKKVLVEESFDKLTELIKPNYKALGPDFGEDAPKIIARLSMDSSETILDHLRTNSKYEMKIDGKTYDLKQKHLVIEKNVPEDYVATESRFADLFLHKEQTEEMLYEGFTRELIRRVQVIRKDMGLSRTDNIELLIGLEESLKEGVEKYISDALVRIGAESVQITSSIPDTSSYDTVKEEKIKGKLFTLAVKQK